MARRIKTITVRLSRDFGDNLDTAKKKFMRKQGLNKLTTVAFTEILSKMKLINPRKNVKKNK